MSAEVPKEHLKMKQLLLAVEQWGTPLEGGDMSVMCFTMCLSLVLLQMICLAW